jgi:hypothetical protein
MEKEGRRFPRFSTKMKEDLFEGRSENAITIRWARLVKKRKIDLSFQCPVRAQLPGIIAQGKYKRGTRMTDWEALVKAEFPGYSMKYVKAIWANRARNMK